MKCKNKDHIGKKMTLDMPSMTPIKSQSDNNIQKTLANFFQKKIHFSSVFDYHGSKQFLNSKKEALQKIVIDDDDNEFSSNDENNNDNNDNFNYIKSVGNKYKKNGAFIHPKTYIKDHWHMHIHPQSTKYLCKYTKTTKTDDNNKKKKKGRKRAKTKGNRGSIRERCFSSQELKMFKDKEIKKIKPIKKANNLLLNNHFGSSKFFHLLESDKSMDSSLVNIVSQMQ